MKGAGNLLPASYLVQRKNAELEWAWESKPVERTNPKLVQAIPLVDLSGNGAYIPADDDLPLFNASIILSLITATVCKDEWSIARAPRRIERHSVVEHILWRGSFNSRRYAATAAVRNTARSTAVRFAA